MADVSAVGATTSTASTVPNSTGASGSAAAYGLGFQELLQIVLTQLTYQDPLKPMDNFEFVSQLAQFTQIQQTQTMSDRVAYALQADAGLLGRKVDIANGTSAFLTGTVKSIRLSSGTEPIVDVEIPASAGSSAATVAVSFSQIRRLVAGE